MRIRYTILLLLLCASVSASAQGSRLATIKKNAAKVLSAFQTKDTSGIDTLVTSDLSVDGKSRGMDFLSKLISSTTIDKYEVVSAVAVDSAVTVVCNRLTGTTRTPVVFTTNAKGQFSSVTGLQKRRTTRATREALHAVEIQDMVSLPFDLVGGFIILRNVMVDGKAMTFLFDSGAETSKFNSEEFENTLPKGIVLQTQSSGVAGVGSLRETFPVRLDTLSIAGNIYSANAMARDYSAFRKQIGLDRLHGIIGYDVMKDLEVHVDYRRRVLTLYRTNEEGQCVCQDNPDVIFNFDFDGDGFLPMLPVTIGGVNLPMIFDLGANGYSIKPAALKKVEGSYKVVGQGSVRDGATTSSGQLVQFGKIKVGNIVKRYPAAVVQSLSVYQDAMGVISMDVFKNKHLSINYRKQQICLY